MYVICCDKTDMETIESNVSRLARKSQTSPVQYHLWQT
jgi:hypothetical protein